MSIPPRYQDLKLIAVAEVRDHHRKGSMGWVGMSQTLIIHTLDHLLGVSNLRTIRMLSLGHCVAFGSGTVGKLFLRHGSVLIYSNVRHSGAIRRSMDAYKCLTIHV